MSTLTHLAILGRQPELGLVELESLIGSAGVKPVGRVAAMLDRELNVHRLGGVQKLGRVLYDGPKVNLSKLPVEMMQSLPMSEGKTPFAVSVYGSGATTKAVLAAGLELKKLLRARGSVRLVAPTDGTALMAAQLKHNQVLERGFELLVVVAQSAMVVAVTTGVQDIEWYSKRDYGRPARSAKVGMLPPKLAQILVNTTGALAVADPFCGTGVVLAEALLMGREAWGADLAPEMVVASRSNLEWLAKMVPTPLPAWQVDEAVDARQVRLPTGVAVVSEGYLGPHLTRSPTTEQVAKMRRELLGLYCESLRNFARQLPRDGEVSMTVPAWRVGGTWQYLGLVDELAALGYTMKVFKHARTPLLYAREDQVVGRQLLLLRKN